MRIGIMQPYFAPYIGYFQLIQSVDLFVIYDNIKYTKQSWINRNRILLNGNPHIITLPLEKGSDHLDVNERYLAASFAREKVKLMRKIEAAYKKAPYYETALPVIEACINFNGFNLFDFLYSSIEVITRFLGVTTPFLISSTLDVDHTKRAQDRVLAICEYLRATDYINSIGGVSLYSSSIFAHHGIDLYFLKTNEFTYKQYSNPFVPNLSIIDLIMFNSKEQICEIINNYSLINNY